MFRHFTAEGVDPFEIRRRIGRASVELDVLDLTDSRVREAVGLEAGDLTGDDYTSSQTIAAAARDAGFEGVLAPSAALPGRTTLVVFARALDSVYPAASQVRQPPPRLASLLPLIRPHEAVPEAVRRVLRALADAGAEPIRRRRQRSR